MTRHATAPFTCRRGRAVDSLVQRRAGGRGLRTCNRGSQMPCARTANTGRIQSMQCRPLLIGVMPPNTLNTETKNDRCQAARYKMQVKG